MKARAEACANFALVKYWGKRAGASPALNLPAAGSISLTVDALRTTTEVEFRADLSGDEVLIGGEAVRAPSGVERAARVLDAVRARAGLELRARVRSENTFPTAAGLASSASGFAALALAASRAAGLELGPGELSALARCGSGSAARSVHGGFVELVAGEEADGADCQAGQLAPPEHWGLRVVVAVTSSGPKPVSSTEGMLATAASSPFFRPWIEAQGVDLEEARAAIRGRDFDRLARVTEHSCLKMHGAMMSGRPALIYWSPATLAGLHEVRRLRAGGLPVCFTIDAGPQLKAICEEGVASAVAARLAELDGVERVIDAGIGGPARVVPAG